MEALLKRPRFQVYTYAFSRLYVDETRKRVAHGPARINPENFFLIFEGEHAQFYWASHNDLKQICLSADGSLVPAETNIFQSTLNMEPVKVDFGLFGLKRNNYFLSAEPDGSVTSSRIHCMNWEHFRICPYRQPTASTVRDSAENNISSTVYINRLLPREAPLVSFIVPIFNQRPYLGELIESVLTQTVKDIELIIVDDGSQDQSGEVAQGFADDRVRYLWQRNSGPSVATNRGIDLARGQYIALLGGDDVCEPWRAEIQLAQIQKENCDLVFDLPTLINEKSEILPDDAMSVFFSRSFYDSADLFRELYFHGNFLCAPSVFARAEFFSKVGRFKAGLLQLQDFEMWVRACRMGAHLVLQNSRSVRYRIRDGSANLSLNPTNYRRSAFEYSFVLRSFFEGASPLLLQKAFPGVQFELDHDSKIPLSFDTLLLYMSHTSALVRSIAGEWIIDALENDGARRGLEARGISTADVFRLTALL